MGFSVGVIGDEIEWVIGVGEEAVVMGVDGVEGELLRLLVVIAGAGVVRSAVWGVGVGWGAVQAWV